MSRSVLFVCTGNTCRSPMAEALFNARAKAAGLPWTASSAGTRAAIGMPLSRGAAKVLAARNAPLPGHRARRVDAALLAGADLVYALDAGHRAELKLEHPAHAGKVRLLREDAGLAPPEVADPVGLDDSLYEEAASLIDEALDIVVRRLPHA